MNTTARDLKWMTKALQLANLANAEHEVPVGAIVIQNETIIGEGFNQPIAKSDPTSHAEINALRQASQFCNNYRLPDVTLYVTLEPCAMCLGAMLHARIKRVVFGAYDPRAGAVTSVFQMANDTRLNHQIEWVGGVMQEPCGDLLRNFFRVRRQTVAASKELNRGVNVGEHSCVV